MVAKLLNIFVTIYRAAYGWKAVCYVLNEDGYHEPETTSYFQYPTPMEAIGSAKDLADQMECDFIMPETFFEQARIPGTLQPIQGWYRCPDVRCNHAFPSKESPKSCPQCGYTSYTPKGE